MAQLLGSNAAIKADVNGANKIPSGELVGRVRCLFDEYTPVANVIAINDTVLIGAPLPAGARILEAVALSPSLGTTGIFDLGWQANGEDVADANGLLSGADAGGQAVKAITTAASVGLGKKFEVETQLQLVFTEASDAALGDTIKVWVYYVLD